MDVETSSTTLRTIVTFGDSITDGLTVNPMSRNTFIENITNLGTDERYPDFLQRRLDAMAPGMFAVVNAGIAGNRLTAGPFAPFFGTAGLERLDTDVIEVPGVTDVIVHMGINDIAFDGPTQSAQTTTIGDTVVAGLEETITRLQAKNLRVVLATVMPAYGANGGGGSMNTAGHGSDISETVRQNVNTWIRGPGAAMADGLIDWAACMHDPNDVRVINPIYNSGDNLHPNAAGYAHMANCIDLAKSFPVTAAVTPPPVAQSEPVPDNGRFGGAALGLLLLPLAVMALRRRRGMHGNTTLHR